MPISDQELRTCRRLLGEVQTDGNVDELTGGSTMLHLAARHNLRYLARTCLVLGADPSLRDSDDHNVLGIAAVNGSFDVMTEIDNFYRRRNQSETLRDLITQEQGRRSVLGLFRIPETGVSFTDLLRRRAEEGENSADLRYFLELENIVGDRIRFETATSVEPEVEATEEEFGISIKNIDAALEDDPYRTIQKLINGLKNINRVEAIREQDARRNEELIELIEEYEELGKEEEEELSKEEGEEIRKEELENFRDNLDSARSRFDNVIPVDVGDRVSIPELEFSEGEVKMEEGFGVEMPTLESDLEEAEEMEEYSREDSPSPSPQTPYLEGTLVREQQRRDQERGL